MLPAASRRTSERGTAADLCPLVQRPAGHHGPGRIEAQSLEEEARSQGAADPVPLRHRHCHGVEPAGPAVLVDGRCIPYELWPRQGPVFGGDIKSNGWVPVPGSEHFSGDLYEPVISPGNITRVVIATPEMIADIAADRADCDATMAGQPGLNGQGNPGGDAGSSRQPDLRPTGELLATGLAHGRRSRDMYRLALRLWRQHGVTPQGAPLPQTVELTCFRVWQATAQHPEPFGWPEALECIRSARRFVQDQEQKQRALASRASEWLAAR